MIQLLGIITLIKVLCRFPSSHSETFLSNPKTHFYSFLEKQNIKPHNDIKACYKHKFQFSTIQIRFRMFHLQASGERIVQSNTELLCTCQVDFGNCRAIFKLNQNLIAIMIPGGNFRSGSEGDRRQGRKTFYPIVLNDFMKIQLNFLWN